MADEIPAELRRIVEFLNDQMERTEVLAIEIRQFVGGAGLRTLVPRVIGRTEASASTKTAGGRPTRSWDEESFFVAIRERAGEAAAEGARALLEWARGNGLTIVWGKGAGTGSFSPRLEGAAGPHPSVTCYSYGRIEVLFQYMKVGPFADDDKREGLRQLLIKAPGLEISPEALATRPPFDAALIAEEKARAAVFAALDWWLGEVRAFEEGR